MKKSIKNILRPIRNLIYKVIPPPFVPVSYSQCGEDAILKFLFKQMGIDKITYLDIGTNWPNWDNNTYLFYLGGSRGVCVEADATLIPVINKYRPKDIILNYGVSVDNKTEADFYIFDEACLNTFDKDEAHRRDKIGHCKIKEIVKVPLININNILEKYFIKCPLFLSIDIENLDFEVLKSIDFKKYTGYWYVPKCLIRTNE